MRAKKKKKKWFQLDEVDMSMVTTIAQDQKINICWGITSWGDFSPIIRNKKKKKKQQQQQQR